MSLTAGATLPGHIQYLWTPAGSFRGGRVRPIRSQPFTAGFSGFTNVEAADWNLLPASMINESVRIDATSCLSCTGFFLQLLSHKSWWLSFILCLLMGCIYSICTDVSLHRREKRNGKYCYLFLFLCSCVFFPPYFSSFNPSLAAKKENTFKFILV